jgi:prophage maintenance system killer protein
VRLNGFALRATADDAEAFLIDEVIQGRAPLARITTWIEEHLELLAAD